MNTANLPIDRRLSDVSILLTQKCDKGCRFCCVDARPSFENHLPFDALCRLQRELDDDEVRPERIALTGGEAFLYRSEGHGIVDVFDLLAGVPRDHISVQTSGWSDAVDEFDDVIGTLAARPYRDRVRFSSSYNLYQRRGIEPRMRRTIDVITRHFRYIHLQNAMDPSNVAETAASFHRVMVDLGFVGPDPAESLPAFLGHKQWVHRAGDRCVVAHFYPAYRAGRGIKTLKTTFVKERQGCPIAAGNKRWLTIDWDGAAKICNSIAAWVTNPRFGTLDQGLRVLLEKHDREMAFVRGDVLAIPWRMLAEDGFQSLCHYCAQRRSGGRAGDGVASAAPHRLVQLHSKDPTQRKDECHGS